MTVEELIDILSGCNPQAVVILSNASQTRISPLDELIVGYWIEDESGATDFVSEDDLIDDENINIDGSEDAVCLISED
jgi:hypothetical protein